MKTAVIYKSVSGFTRNYAEWIADELDGDLFAYSETDPAVLQVYELIIFGGALHAVGIAGIDIIKDNMEKLQGKNIIVFTTGASPARDGILEEVKNRNFSPEEQKRIRFFYLRGGFDYGKLNFVNKLLMTLMKWKIRSKKESDRTPDERGMLAAFSQPVDFTKKEKTGELIAYARSVGA